MKLTYIKQAGEPNGDAGDQYTGLDRFGRVVDQRWPDGSAEMERVDYGFTRASNQQWRQNRVAATGQDEYYNYDGLYQVAELNRGTLNGGKTAISGTPAWPEDFTYDPIGNWDAYLTKVSGVTDLDQSRTHNTANETVEIDGSTATVSSDLAGNMTTVPQVADWSSTNELKWDAWNRLVEVVDGETTVALYRYDGKTRRVSKETDASRHYFYSDRWQILEERLNSETTADRQFIWGQRYLDDLVLRDRDVDHDGSMDERLYVLSDYFNPTAIADEDGVVLERYGYNAFGLSRVMDADFEPRSTSDYDWETRYGAYRYDAETGFYQVRYRYLHSTLGRWLSRDPIGDAGGANFFAYVANRSINRIDRHGLIDWSSAKSTGEPAPDAGGVKWVFFDVKTDAGSPIVAWKPADNISYSCHGFTFDGLNQPGGPFSPDGSYIGRIISGDGWKHVCCAEASGGIAVFRKQSTFGGITVNAATHSGKISQIAFAGSGFDEGQSMLKSKQGITGALTEESFAVNSARWGRYSCYVKNPVPENSSCCGDPGPGEDAPSRK